MKLDILAFGAHPDDVEISMGGTLLRYISEGKKVGIVDLTEGELGTRGTVKRRYAEAEAASKFMSIETRMNLQMKDGFFQHNEENLFKIIEQIRRFKPEIVFANSISDRHPDHRKGAKLVAEAAYLSGLIKIKSTWQENTQEAHRPRLVLHYIQDYLIPPTIVFDVSPFINKKLDAIKCYKSQFYDPDSNEPSTPISGEDFFEFLKGRMKEFGRPMGVEYAEGFTSEKIIGVSDIFKLR
ncbi:MAG: bacillithiol biosynthesis deacetylase BshB1 [Bacteroidetes bacterium]|nr:bacillithiol biosynthesis deacetylase BshB1 [Bacteroidota bacterium]